MSEQNTIFSSKVKHSGIFDFAKFYQFCYEWLTEETRLLMSEKKYSEKLKSDSKNIDIEWYGFRKLTDYFKFDVKIEFQVLRLKQIEITKNNAKIKTNEGDVELKIKGILVRDYDGKFETSAFKKFLRSIYEKWVIKSRIDEMEEKIIRNCDEFLGQAKAYLDLEGKR